MAEKKLYATRIYVDASITLSVHASSEKEAADIFSDYLRAEGIDARDLEVDGYWTSVHPYNVHEEDENNLDAVNIDDYFDEEED